MCSAGSAGGCGTADSSRRTSGCRSWSGGPGRTTTCPASGTPPGRP
ncbi:hypothetical protein [Ornithinimicrobium kibberense]